MVTDNLDVKLRFNKLGNELSFVIGVHFDPQNLLKSLAFSLKSVASLLYIQWWYLRLFFSIYESF